MDGFGVDGTDKDVDYGKVLVFIKENRLHQVGITANVVRKRLEEEGRLKDLEAAKKEEERKKEEEEKKEKRNPMSNLFKLYSRTLLLTTKKKPKKDEDEENKEDKTEDGKTEDGKNKNDKNKEDETKTDKTNKDEEANHNDAKKEESHNKNYPSTKISTPTKTDVSPQTETDKHSDTIEEEGQPDDTKPKTDTIKKIGNLFKFLSRPPGKTNQDKISDKESPVADDGKDANEKSSDEKAKDTKIENKESPKSEEEKLTEETPSKDSKIERKESPEDVKSLDVKPRKDSKLNNEESLIKVHKDSDVDEDSKYSPKEKEQKSPAKTSEANAIKLDQKVKDKDEDVNEKPSYKTEDVVPSRDSNFKESKKEDKKHEVDKKNDKEPPNEKKDEVKQLTPEEKKWFNEKENKLSPTYDSDEQNKQNKDDKGSHIEEYIPDFDEYLDSPEAKSQDKDGKDKDSPIKKDDKLDQAKKDTDVKLDKSRDKIPELWPLPGDEASNYKVNTKTDKEKNDDEATNSTRMSNKDDDHTSSHDKNREANKIDSEITDDKSSDNKKSKVDDKNEINLIDINEDDTKRGVSKPNDYTKNNKENNLISDDIKNQIDNKYLNPGNDSHDENKTPTKDKMNENLKPSDPKSGKIAPPSYESKNKEKPDEENDLLIDLDDEKNPKAIKPSENDKNKNSAVDDVKPGRDSKELTNQKPHEDDANKITNDKRVNETKTDISKPKNDLIFPKNNTNKLTNDKTNNDTKTSLPKSAEPGKDQKLDGKGVSTTNEKLDNNKDRAQDELGVKKVIDKEIREKEQPKDVETKTKPDRKGPTVKISNKTVTIDDTKKPEKSKSNDKLKVSEKGNHKEITKAASSDKIRNTPKTNSMEKLRSTEKLTDPKKAKVPGILTEKSKSSDRLGLIPSSEKLRDPNLSAKRKSLQPPSKADVKDLSKTSRPRSVSLKPDFQTNRKKSDGEKKDHLKSKTMPGGRMDPMKTQKLSESDECLEKIPVDEEHIKRCRKHRKQLKQLVEVDNVLVLHTQASYTSEEEKQEAFDDPLGNKTNGTLLEQNSMAPKNLKTTKNEVRSLPDSKKNDIKTNNKSNKKQTSKRGGNGSEVVQQQGSKEKLGKEITSNKNLGNQTKDEQSSDKSNFKGHPGIKTKTPGSRWYDPLGEVSDSSLEDDWHDTKSYISSSDWYDAKSHVSTEQYSGWKAYNSIPHRPDYNRKQNPYVDPRLTFLDDVDNNRSVRNSRIPIPSRNLNSVKTVPNTPNYPEDRYIPFRSRSKSPDKSEKRKRTFSEGIRKRPPMKTIINKPLRNVEPKEFSNISNLKADKNHAESLKAIRPSYLRTASYMPPSRIEQYLKVQPNHDKLDDRKARSEHQLPYIRLPDDMRSRNPPEESYRFPSEFPPFKRSPSPSGAKYDHREYSPQLSSSPRRNRLDDYDDRHTRRSHNDLVDETDGIRYLDPRSLCPQNICRSRCNCLSRSADDLEDFSNSSSILKLTFVPPNRKPAWRL